MNVFIQFTSSLLTSRFFNLLISLLIKCSNYAHSNYIFYFDIITQLIHFNCCNYVILS